MSRVIAINGSPRKLSNTATLYAIILGSPIYFHSISGQM